MAFVVWLLSPYTKGASLLYRKFVHPTLSSKEKVMLFLAQATVVGEWAAGAHCPVLPLFLNENKAEHFLTAPLKARSLHEIMPMPI